MFLLVSGQTWESMAQNNDTSGFGYKDNTCEINLFLVLMFSCEICKKGELYKSATVHKNNSTDFYGVRIELFL